MMGGAAVLLVITPGLAWVLRDPKALAQQVAGTQAPTQAATGSSRLAPEPAGVE